MAWILWYLWHPIEGKLHWDNNILGIPIWHPENEKNQKACRDSLTDWYFMSKGTAYRKSWIHASLGLSRNMGVVNMWPPAINWLAIKEFPWASKHSGARQCEKCVRAHCQEERSWWTTENFYRLRRTPVVPREFCYIPRPPQLILGWCWNRQETQKLIC